MNNQIISSSSLKKTKVHNRDDKNIGKIEDLAINFESGKVVYAVLSFGGFLGMGDKHFAIPLEAFEFHADDSDKITLDVDKDKLKDAPGFDEKSWPEQPSSEFVDSVYTHYGYERQTARI